MDELGILGKLLSCHFVVIFFFFFRAKFVSPESWLKASSLWKVIPPFLNSSFVAIFRSRLAVDASINPKIVDLPPRDKYVEEFQIWRKKTGSLFLPPWLMIYAWLRFCLPAEVNKHFKELGFGFCFIFLFAERITAPVIIDSLSFANIDRESICRCSSLSPSRDSVIFLMVVITGLSWIKSFLVDLEAPRVCKFWWLDVESDSCLPLGLLILCDI